MSTLKKNIAYNFIYQVLILLLPLVTAPYLARVIGASGVGSYSYTFTVATYFVYIVKLGLDNYGNRTIASVQNDRYLMSKQFCSIFALQLCCFGIAVALYTCYWAFFAQDKILTAVQGVYLLSSLFDINWFFFGIERFSITVIRNTAIKLITTVLIFTFVKTQNDVVTYTLIMSSGFLVSQLALWPFVPRYIDYFRPSLREITVHIKPNAILFVSVIAISIYNMMSRLMLGSMSGMEQVGYFENAAKLISVPTALINAVGTVMLPRSSYLLSNGGGEESLRYIEKTITGVMCFSFLSLFGITVISSGFVRWFYGHGFDETAICLSILSVTVPILGFGNVIRTQYLIPSGGDRVFLLSAICGAVVSLVANLVLIPTYGATGAAIASVAAESAVLSCQVMFVWRSIPVFDYAKKAGVFLVSGVVMHCVLGGIGAPQSNLLEIMSTAVIGSVVYGAVVLLEMSIVKAIQQGRS